MLITVCRDEGCLPSARWSGGCATAVWAGPRGCWLARFSTERPCKGSGPEGSEGMDPYAS